VIYLVRHGQTVFNAAARWQGQVDSPLTARGLRQAAAAGETLRGIIADNDIAVFCSPLGRAHDTAKIIAEKIGYQNEMQLDPRLMEIGMGSWEGLTDYEIEQEWPNARDGLERHEWFFHSPDGETYDDILARTQDALSEIANHSAPIKIIVSHGVTGRIIRSIHANIPKNDALKLEVPQDALYRLSDNGHIERIAFGI
jgi:probable phosphoglycerate mutase